MERWHAERSGYATIQGSRPQTLAYALTDSPAGRLAWNAEWFEDYGDGVGTLDRDDIFTNVTLYWLTATAGSSARLYREGAAVWEKIPAPSSVPTGVAAFPGDATLRRLAERDHRVVHWSEFGRGGHFAALQVPDLLVGDVRSFFRRLR